MRPCDSRERAPPWREKPSKMAGQQEFVSFVYVRKGRKDFYFILFMKMLKMLVQEKKKGREKILRFDCETGMN